jgi:DNA invertase Pin-like site-specific DNA recombinase
MSNEIRAVAYARVSSKEQADKELSIPAQLEAIRNYCKQKGWKLITEYIDAGKSAKTDERPEFQRMIAMAKRQNRNFEIIVVHKFDRFSRNRDDHVIYKSLLKKLGVSVHSVTEQTDSETPHGFLLEGIMEVISEFYNMNLKNETMKGMRENAKRGFHNGGIAPYGYRTDVYRDAHGATKSVWVLGPDEEVRVIRRIFDLYVHQNKGYKAIVSILNEEKVPSPNGKLWSWSTVWHILHNEAYIGQKIWNKYDYSSGKKKKPKEEWIISTEGQPAIIDRDTFYAVESKSKERNYSEGAFKSTGPSLFLLRGLLICPDCGVRMVTGSNGKSSRGKTRYYHCGTYHRKGSKSCKRNAVYKEKIESAVINALIREFSILSFPGSLEDELNRYNEYKSRDIQYQIARLDDELKRLQQRLETASKEKNIDEDNKYFNEYINQLKSDVSNIESQKNQIMSTHSSAIIEPTSLVLVRHNLKVFASNIKTYPPDQQYEMLKSYISQIVFDHITNSFKISLVIHDPQNMSEKHNCLLEKTIYISLD